MNEDFEKYVISKIEALHNKKNGKVEPDYVLYVDLLNSIMKDLKDTLNGFYKSKRYTIGKTLNDKYIKDENWK